MSGVGGLVEFLLARLDEDAMTALNAAAEWHEQDWAEIDGYPQAHVFLHDPARVLADCNVKRRMVARKPRLSAPDEAQDVWWDLMALLALPYAGHPDYDPAWRL